MNPYAEAFRRLARARVSYLVVGAFGANLYGERAGVVIRTLDCDLLLPPDAKVLARALRALRKAGFRFEAGREPLPEIDPLVLAGIVRARACVRAVAGKAQIDLPLEIAGFPFTRLWKRRRRFRIEGTLVNVAPLQDILRSKELAGREKDLLFLATYRDALEQLLEQEANRPVRHKRKGGRIKRR